AEHAVLECRLLRRALCIRSPTGWRVSARRRGAGLRRCRAPAVRCKGCASPVLIDPPPAGRYGRLSGPVAAQRPCVRCDTEYPNVVARAATLLIPSETRVREFDGKLLLACIAAEQGHECVVGSPMAMHLHIGRLPLGIYIAKDMFCSSARMLRILRGLGHDVVGWDEESL